MLIKPQEPLCHDTQILAILLDMNKTQGAPLIHRNDRRGDFVGE